MERRISRSLASGRRAILITTFETSQASNTAQGSSMAEFEMPFGLKHMSLLLGAVLTVVLLVVEA